MKLYKKFVFQILCLAALFQGHAAIKLPALFSDNMMLQQQSNAPICGWADKNQNVKVKTSWDAKTYVLKADKDGKWKIALKTPEAGGPYTITVSDAKEVKTIKNILIGEVWLCSGQSNMEMPLKGFQGQPVLKGNEAIVHSRNNKIRFITVPRATVLTPNEDFVGQWNVASAQTTGDFSATAWYFGSLLPL